MEEDEFDVHVYLDEESLIDEDTRILRDIEEHSAKLARLSKWARPSLYQSYVSESRSIVFQQLEIDYVIGENHKEILPNRSGPAAIICIFGVTREGRCSYGDRSYKLCWVRFDCNHALIASDKLIASDVLLGSKRIKVVSTALAVSYLIILPCHNVRHLL